MENQSKFWLPWNELSSELFYNQRIIVSMPMKTPITYRISKVENTTPKGINMFTIYQDEFNANTDVVCLKDNEPEGLKYGEMYADYYTYGNQKPVEEPDNIGTEDAEKDILTLDCKVSTIKVGGSNKTITGKLFDSDGNEVTDKYLSSEWNWTYRISNNDSIKSINRDVVDKNGEPLNNNILKISLDENSETDIGEVITVTCTVNAISQQIELDIVAL